LALLHYDLVEVVAATDPPIMTIVRGGLAHNRADSRPRRLQPTTAKLK
jgi:hypothetical protein